MITILEDTALGKPDKIIGYKIYRGGELFMEVPADVNPYEVLNVLENRNSPIRDRLEVAVDLLSEVYERGEDAELRERIRVFLDLPSN